MDEDPLVVLATMREKYGNDVAAHMFTPIPESLAEIVRGWFFDTGNPRATQQVYPGYAGGPLEEPDDEEDYKMEQAPSQNDPDYDEKFAKWYQNHITKVHAQREKIKRRRIAREQEKAKQEEYERKLEQQGTPIDRGVKPRGRDPGPGWEYDTVNHLWRKVKEKAEEQPKKPILPPVAPLDAQPIDTHFPEAIDPVFEDKGEENSHEFSPEEIDAYIAREKAKAQRVNRKKGRGRKSYFN